MCALHVCDPALALHKRQHKQTYAWIFVLYDMCMHTNANFRSTTQKSKKGWNRNTTITTQLLMRKLAGKLEGVQTSKHYKILYCCRARHLRCLRKVKVPPQRLRRAPLVPAGQILQMANRLSVGSISKSSQTSLVVTLLVSSCSTLSASPPADSRFPPDICGCVRPLPAAMLRAAPAAAACCCATCSTRGSIWGTRQG